MPGTHPDLPSLLAHRAGLTPDALALVDGVTTLTYRQLVAAARALAVQLQDSGVRRGDAVALLTRRSARTVVAQLALWWAGAVCVPLDPAHPRVRTAAMIADSGAVLTVGDAELLESADMADMSGARLALSEDVVDEHGRREDVRGDAGSAALLEPHPKRRPEPLLERLPGPGPDATAFIMFTSGSTGRPKGVAVRHRAVAALVTDPSYVTVSARDRVLLHSPATFDASTFEVWLALGNGAAVVVCPSDRPSFEDLAREVEKHGVTVAFFTTALFHQLAARRSRIFALLRSVVVGGETLSALHARSVLREFPWLELVNGYGPTETTTFATAHRVTGADGEGPVPVGRPIAGATAHVLDEDGRTVAAGTRGELWIGGSRLARGYAGQPELTAERFVTHPSLGLLYRTGDLASARPDGVLDFHGRTDDQVKVRGHRIEPGEIEHVLRKQPEVDDAAVTVRRPAPDDARLAAFVVTAAGAAQDLPSLRARLTELLPGHLVPDELTALDRLPLTASGKVDRRALADLDPATTARAGALATAGVAGAGNAARAASVTGTAGTAGATGATGAGEWTRPAPPLPQAPAASPVLRDRTEDSPRDRTQSLPRDRTEDLPQDRAQDTATHQSGPEDTALQQPGPEDTAPPHPAPPMTPLQEAVADVWTRSLGCEVASPDADFLALGGHSLLALVVTDDLREELGVELSLADFFAAPTVAGHAALVERALLAAHTDLHPLPVPASLPPTDVPEHLDVP